MKYTTLGNTDIKVSQICVGGMSFGEASEDFHTWVLNYEDTKNMISHALDLGVNFIDTANTYSHGTSEAYIGKALKELGVKREDVVIATKVYFNEGHLSREAILREIDGSLERLGLDYVDLYQIHRYDYTTPEEETMTALDEVVKAGKARALGASAMYGYQFHNYQLAAEKVNGTLFSTMQNHYNLIYREDERELIPVCKQYNVSLIPYSPLAAGHLARANWDADTKRAQSDKVMKQKYDHAKDDDMAIIERVQELAESYGVSMSEIALGWLLAKGVAAPIVGATKIPHFDQAVKAVDITLNEDDIAFLEKCYKPHSVVGALPDPNA